MTYAADLRQFLEAAHAADVRATEYRVLMSSPANTPSQARHYAELVENYESLARTTLDMVEVFFFNLTGATENQE